MAATAHRLCSAGILALVAVQAFLAGQHLYAGGDIALHGYLGNGTFSLALVATVIAAVWKRDALLAMFGFILCAAMTAQIGSGYLGREELDIAAVHVGLGVLVTGLATVHFLASWPSLLAPFTGPGAARSAAG